jgi:hypothetical protein
MKIETETRLLEKLEAQRSAYNALRKASSEGGFIMSEIKVFLKHLDLGNLDACIDDQERLRCDIKQVEKNIYNLYKAKARAMKK